MASISSTGAAHGNDNLVRSATIQTVNGLSDRSISKLYPLEVNSGTDVSGGKSKDIAEEEDDDYISMPEAEPNPLSSMHPQRSAAVKARARVSECNKILWDQEDVMTDCIFVGCNSVVTNLTHVYCCMLSL